MTVTCFSCNEKGHRSFNYLKNRDSDYKDKGEVAKGNERPLTGKAKAFRLMIKDAKDDRDMI